ncbi:MAG: hypothetical protein ACK58T_24900 [Phycisphaerae bacterium]
MKWATGPHVRVVVFADTMYRSKLAPGAHVLINSRLASAGLIAISRSPAASTSSPNATPSFPSSPCPGVHASNRAADARATPSVSA